MTDTYARVMRSADEPGNRRTPRSRAPRRSGAAPGPVTTAAAAVGTSGAEQDLPATPLAAPAGKPRRSKTAKTPATKPKTSDQARGKSARSTAPLAGAVAPLVKAAVRVPGPPVQAPGSRAQETFTAAAAAFLAGRDAQVHRDVQFEDVPAPKRLAPYATAIAATVQRDDADVAWGRLVLLYDPDGQPGWDGFFRLVAYIRAEVEPEMAADPLLGEVGWSWLSEALDAHVPGYAVPSGTVTRVITEGFGAKRDELPLSGFELRASWSPAAPGDQGSAGLNGLGPGQSDLGTLDLSAHIAAWCDCLSAAAGLEPPGTRALRQPGCG